MQRQTQLRLIQSTASSHSRWLDRLSEKYGRPRVELVRLLSAPGALEREIAVLISDAALRKARELRETREWPDEDSDDLFDRAVVGHWRRLRDAEMAEGQAHMAELKSQLAE